MTEITEVKLWEIWSILDEAKQRDAKYKGIYFYYRAGPAFSLISLGRDKIISSLVKDIEIHVTPLKNGRFQYEESYSLEYNSIADVALDSDTRMSIATCWIDVKKLGKYFNELLQKYKKDDLILTDVKGLRSYDEQKKEVIKKIHQKIDIGFSKNRVELGDLRGKIEGCAFWASIFSFEADGFIEIIKFDVNHAIFISIVSKDDNPLNRTRLEEQIAIMSAKGVKQIDIQEAEQCPIKLNENTGEIFIDDKHIGIASIDTKPFKYLKALIVAFPKGIEYSEIVKKVGSINAKGRNNSEASAVCSDWKRKLIKKAQMLNIYLEHKGSRARICLPPPD